MLINKYMLNKNIYFYLIKGIDTNKTRRRMKGHVMNQLIIIINSVDHYQQ